MLQMHSCVQASLHLAGSRVVDTDKNTGGPQDFVHVSGDPPPPVRAAHMGGEGGWWVPQRLATWVAGLVARHFGEGAYVCMVVGSCPWPRIPPGFAHLTVGARARPLCVSDRPASLAGGSAQPAKIGDPPRITLREDRPSPLSSEIPRASPGGRIGPAR